MNAERLAYLAELYTQYSDYDASQSDRLQRWRSIEPESAELLALLVLAKQAKSLLEIGTSGGYSTLWLADAVEQTGGRLTTLEIESARRDVAVQHLKHTGLADYAEALCTDAAAFLAENQVQYDLILLDAERPAYVGYWPHLRRCLAKSGSLLVVDNVLSHAAEVAEFQALVSADSAFQKTVLPIGAGLLLVVRR